MEENDWVKLIGGGFAHMTAPFASHPLDQKRAREYSGKAKKAGLTINDALRHAKEYLSTQNITDSALVDQLDQVSKYYKGKL